MTIAQTAWFYLLVIFASAMFAHRSDITGKKGGLVAATLLLIFVSGFRGYDVGRDTLGYKEGVEFFFLNGTQMWNHTFSDGYGWFTRAILTLYNNYTFLLVVQAAITCGLFAIRLWDFRKGCSIGFGMFVYAVTEYPLSLCLMCQCLSISLVFFATRYLDRHQPAIFVLLLVIAALNHTSALIGLTALALYLFKLESKTKAQLYGKAMGAIVIFAGGVIAAQMLIDRYARYSVNESEAGLMVVAQALVLVGSLFFAGRFSKERRSSMTSQTGCSLPLYAFGIVLSASSYVIPNAGRIAYYFTVFSPVVFGYLVRDSGRNKSAFVLGFLLVVWLLFYAWYAYLLHTGLGIETYSFVWMQ